MDRGCARSLALLLLLAACVWNRPLFATRAPVGNAPVGARYQPPRTPEGRPDFTGVWTNASLTTLTRPREAQSLVLTPAQADEMARNNFHNQRAAQELVPSDPNRSAPPVAANLPPVGNYNASWVEPGTTYAVVKGEIRSSWIVSPANGRIPFRARDRALGDAARRREGPTDPESLSLSTRCLLGFGGSAGPPMMNVLYNNYYQFVQTRENLMILVEMVHDARMIRMGAEHGSLPRWLGDSTGRWDGDTLVAETKNFHPARARGGPFSYSSQAVVTERFTRVGDRELLYEFTVADPENYTEPIRGEMTFRRVDSQVYEYACHEGNYAMTHILEGARLEEREAAAQGKGRPGHAAGTEPGGDESEGR
jgi:hypothetical protein